jgi:hypothetical protein
MTRLVTIAVLAMLAATASTARAQDLPIWDPARHATAPVGNQSQFEHGEPHKVVDAVGWVFGIPKKLIVWDRRAVNHRVSDETERDLSQYMEANGLSSTKVRVNEYDPIGEWRRLGSNKEVGAGWRYTFGALGTLGYTLFPGRLFGTDGYNPYTDTIYVYSDIPCLAEEQASYAKLVRARRYPGSYVAVTSLPFIQLLPEKQSKTEVLDYTLSSGTPDEQREATRVLYAEFGAEVGGQASVLLGAGLPLTFAGAGVGHVAATAEAKTTR